MKIIEEELDDFLINTYYSEDSITVNCRWLQDRLRVLNNTQRELVFNEEINEKLVTKLQKKIDILEASLEGLKYMLSNRRVLNVSA